MAGFVEVRGLRKRFGSVWAVDGVSFEVPEGALLVLLGPSGCGKTTTLRCIAGLERPDEGEIVIDGIPVTNSSNGTFVPPEQRGMGMVAQSYAIWPHMTVFENIAFPLRMRREESRVIRERVNQALEMVGLAGFGDRNATELSGGQQQRVALARAIVGRPRVLLFDEPLSNLDAGLRERMRFLLKELQRQLGTTAVYVTHDQTEAMGLGDELIVMRNGRIEQRGTAWTLYNEPANRFVAEFIGIANILEGELVGDSAAPGKSIAVRLRSDGTVIRCRAGSAPLEKSVAVVIRPEWFRVETEDPGPEQNVLRARVTSCQYLGDRTELRAMHKAGPLRITVPGWLECSAGEEMYLRIDPGKCLAIPES